MEMPIKLWSCQIHLQDIYTKPIYILMQSVSLLTSGFILSAKQHVAK